MIYRDFVEVNECLFSRNREVSLEIPKVDDFMEVNGYFHSRTRKRIFVGTW